MTDFNKNLRGYMLSFPNSFVGFFDSVSEILKSLGDDWIADGKKEYGEVFLKSAISIKEISYNLMKVRDEFDKVANEPITASKLVEDFKNKVLKKVAV